MYFYLVVAWWVTRHGGVTAALTVVRDKSQLIHPARSTTVEAELSHAIQILERVIKWCPYQPLCLERSLAMSLFLMSKGIRTDVKIGVKRPRFGAHSWVQLGDRIIGDDPSVASMYTVIASALR